jgi:hypothetical protein
MTYEIVTATRVHLEGQHIKKMKLLKQKDPKIYGKDLVLMMNMNQILLEEILILMKTMKNKGHLMQE